MSVPPLALKYVDMGSRSPAL